MPLGIDLGIGEARIIVPDDVCVATTADVGIGNVSLFGRDNGGIDVDVDDSPAAEPATTRVVLDAEVGLGEVRVLDETGAVGLGDDHFGPFDHDGSDLEGAGNAACGAGGARASG